MKKLNTIIIDDEDDAVKLLTLELGKMQDRIRLQASFTNPEDALQYIKTKTPDLVFLDIEMPHLNGFELLNNLHEINFSVVFITAYDKFAIKAFRYQALDYITKPIDADLLKEAIEKASRQKINNEQLKELNHTRKFNTISKIAIPGSKGLHFIALKEICCIEASDNYANIYLANGHKMMCNRSLKEMEQLLDEEIFFRIHRQYIVNLEQVTQLSKTEGLLTLSNNMTVSVSREQKDKLMLRFKSL